MVVWEAKAGMEVVPVFMLVDPERDNVEQVCEYVKEFHPDLIGLTGTADEIRPVAHAFRVYYMKMEQEGVMLHFCRRQAKVQIQCLRFPANVGSQEDQFPLYIEELFPRCEDTGMDRVTGCLMNPNMEFVKFFGKNYDADALAEGVVKEIKACAW